MGIGTMLRHTAGAITVYVVVIFVAFLIVLALPQGWQDHVAKFMPEVLTGAMRSSGSSDLAFPSFSALTSTLVLAGYALASVVAGAILLVRRDA